jgi:myosin XV
LKCFYFKFYLEWTWSEYAQMIKFTKSPIVSSLLKHDKLEMSQVAVNCFVEIMKFMGDYPLKKSQKDTDCIYFLLQTLHHYHDLNDEIYCQIIKQTTNNKSIKQDSCQKGWRLMSIICTYCKTSITFKPYLFAHLERNAYDTKRPYNDIAQICLSSLRKTIKYGGRKNVPSQVELDALIVNFLLKLKCLNLS